MILFHWIPTFMFLKRCASLEIDFSFITDSTFYYNPQSYLGPTLWTTGLFFLFNNFYISISIGHSSYNDEKGQEVLLLSHLWPSPYCPYDKTLIWINCEIFMHHEGDHSYNFWSILWFRCWLILSNSWRPPLYTFILPLCLHFQPFSVISANYKPLSLFTFNPFENSPSYKLNLNINFFANKFEHKYFLFLWRNTNTFLITKYY